MPGRGLEGAVNGEHLRIGTRVVRTGDSGAQMTPTPADRKRSRSGSAGPEGLLARFEIAEQVRAGAAEAIAALAASGIDVAIASGDQPGPVRAAARRLGVNAWHAACSPKTSSR